MTCGTFSCPGCCRKNVPPKDVQVIADHADYSTTMNIYGHLMPGAKKEAAKKLDKLFEKGN